MSVDALDPLLLADGRMAQELTIDLARPRSLDHPDFIALRRTLLQGLGVDVELKERT